MLVSVKIDPATGDLALNSRGENELVSGVDAFVQNVRTAFQFFRGDWFLDRSQGVPYYESILGQKGVSFETLNVIWRQVLLSRPGVISVVYLETTWVNYENREARVDWEVETDQGLVSSFDYEPFVVRVPGA